MRDYVWGAVRTTREPQAVLLYCLEKATGSTKACRLVDNVQTFFPERLLFVFVAISVIRYSRPSSTERGEHIGVLARINNEKSGQNTTKPSISQERSRSATKGTPRGLLSNKASEPTPAFLSRLSSLYRERQAVFEYHIMPVYAFAVHQYVCTELYV